ncbi:hypothetical protein LguiA_022346 [Lonicera macranthoides]
MSDYLPPEVLNEIITRLPVKSLLRCTSVCKSWYSLIASPKFITTHLNRNNNSNNHLLIRNFVNSFDYSVYRDNETFDKLSTLEFPLPGYFRIIGSCNGLICLSSYDVDTTETVILWNPSIRKYVTLPRPSVTLDSNGPFHHTLGFGFHSATNDYKVVRVVYHIPDHFEILTGPKVELYQLSTGCWRNINAEDFKYIVSVRDPQAFLNGVIHWTGIKNDGVPYLIVSFNMENEALGSMMVPHSLQHGFPPRVAVFGDSLSLMQLIFSGNDRHCCTWVMQEYGIAKSWTKQFTIDLNKGFLKAPFGIRGNGNALLATVNENGLGDLVSYDPKSKQMKNLGIRGQPYAFNKDTYVESLVLLRGLSDVLGRQQSSCDAVALEGASFLRKQDDESQGNKRMKR